MEIIKFILDIINTISGVVISICLVYFVIMWIKILIEDGRKKK